jgi:hypothetical protein
MTPELALYIIMVESGMVINDGTMHSLRDAVRDGNVYFFDDDGRPSGFCTWRFKDSDLIIENLCMFSKNGLTKLFKLREFFHTKYPNLSKVKWYQESRGKDMEYVFIEDEQHHRPISLAENNGS